MEQQLIDLLLKGHGRDAVMVGLGAFLANPGPVVAMAANLVLKLPWVRAGVAANPKRALAIADAIRAEVYKDVAEIAGGPATPPAAPSMPKIVLPPAPQP